MADKKKQTLSRAALSASAASKLWQKELIYLASKETLTPEEIVRIRQHYALSESQLSTIFKQDVIPGTFGNRPPSAKPKMVIVGGPIGCGKTGLANEIRNGIAYIDRDLYRQFHPKFDEVKKLFPGYMAEVIEDNLKLRDMAVKYAIQNGLDFMTEQTYKDKGVVSLIDMAKAAAHPDGTAKTPHTVEANAIAIPFEFAAVRAINRYAEMIEDVGVKNARYEDLAKQEKIYNGIVDTLNAVQKRADEVTIYNHRRECRTKLARLSPDSPGMAGNLFEQGALTALVNPSELLEFIELGKSVKKRLLPYADKPSVKVALRDLETISGVLENQMKAALPLRPLKTEKTEVVLPKTPARRDFVDKSSN